MGTVICYCSYDPNPTIFCFHPSQLFLGQTLLVVGNRVTTTTTKVPMMPWTIGKARGSTTLLV